MAKIPFTAAAYRQMETELAQLVKLREEVMERLKIAREMGDLSENGAYRYAKFELGNIGRKMRHLNYLLKNGEITEKASSEVIDFGCMVTLKNANREMTFTLVSEHESNPAEGKLSLQSPIGQAVKGKKAGDEVIVHGPQGDVTYTIERVE